MTLLFVNDVCPTTYTLLFCSIYIHLSICVYVSFCRAWNEIIDNFRAEDIISNQEMGYLKFSSFSSLTRPIYFPNFLLAGVIDDCLHVVERGDFGVDGRNDFRGNNDAMYFRPIVEDVVKSTACCEVWELGGFVLSELLGLSHSNDLEFVVKEVGNWSESGG